MAGTLSLIAPQLRFYSNGRYVYISILYPVRLPAYYVFKVWNKR